MINREHLLDALSLLPDELLIPVDKLRQKKHISWKPLVSLAACLCLMAGLWFLAPGDLLDKGLNGNGGGNMAPDSSQVSPEAAPYQLTFSVTAVFDDHIQGRQDPNSQAVEIYFDNLTNVPSLSVGQEIIVFCSHEPEDNEPLHPIRIELKEN